MRALVAELRQSWKGVAGGGGGVSRQAYLSGKMLARQRVDLLIDQGTAFLELSPLAATAFMAATCTPPHYHGVGRIAGRKHGGRPNDATIKGGTYYR